MRMLDWGTFLIMFYRKLHIDVIRHMYRVYQLAQAEFLRLQAEANLRLQNTRRLYDMKAEQEDWFDRWQPSTPRRFGPGF